MKYVLAIDQGTTSTRAILFDEALMPVASAQEEFPRYSQNLAGSNMTLMTYGAQRRAPAAR